MASAQGGIGLAIAFLVASACSRVAGPGPSAEPGPAAPADLERLQEQLRREGDFAEPDLAAAGRNLAVCLRYRGCADEALEIARAAGAQRCGGSCLADLLGALGDAHRCGLQAGEAVDLVLDVFGKLCQERASGHLRLSDRALGARVRAQVQEALDERERRAAWPWPLQAIRIRCLRRSERRGPPRGCRARGRPARRGAGPGCRRVLASGRATLRPHPDPPGVGSSPC